MIREISAIRRQEAVIVGEFASRPIPKLRVGLGLKERRSREEEEEEEEQHENCQAVLSQATYLLPMELAGATNHNMGFKYIPGNWITSRIIQQGLQIHHP